MIEAAGDASPVLELNLFGAHDRYFVKGGDKDILLTQLNRYRAPHVQLKILPKRESA